MTKDKINERQNRSLFDAIEQNDLNLVKQLLGGGASANYPSIEEPHFRPLEFAIDELEFDGSLNIVKLLIESGADVNAWDVEYATKPINHAIFTLDRDCLELLLESGASPNIASDAGVLPLVYLAEAGKTELVALLLKFGADRTINEFQAVPSYTALNYAVANLNISMAKVLLEAGADPVNAHPYDFLARHYLPELKDGNASKHREMSELLALYEVGGEPH